MNYIFVMHEKAQGCTSHLLELVANMPWGYSARLGRYICRWCKVASMELCRPHPAFFDYPVSPLPCKDCDVRSERTLMKQALRHSNCKKAIAL